MANRYDHRNIIHIQKTIFLPMFCRLSIKDVTLNNTALPRNHAPATSGEPSSPVVSCTGKVKRNNRYKKHTENRKKHFSGKTGGGEMMPVTRRSRLKSDVNVAEMDPPLPVMKRVAPPQDEANLWKRRVNGVGGLRSLEIQCVRRQACKYQP